jgi:hypothetical protein
MSTTVQKRRIDPLLASRHSRLSAGFAAVAATSCALAVALAGGDGSTREGGRELAGALPSPLPPAEQVAVAAALRSPDSRRQRIARQVAGGQAGASALADPATLYHHGVDTSRTPLGHRGELAAQRFHHR